MTDHPVKRRKKLIEVAIPLEAINAESQAEKKNPFIKGHPRSLHQYWARRPLAAARALLFCQLVDDPSSIPEEFRDEESQEIERIRLFSIVTRLIEGGPSVNEEALVTAKNEILKSWQRCCSDNAGHPNADKLFNPLQPPAVHDPFSGGTSIPLEAQRLGLEAYATDLNPLPVLLGKAAIEIPHIFYGKPAANPQAKSGRLAIEEPKGCIGIAEDVAYYAKQVHERVKRQIGEHYPTIKVSEEMCRERPELKRYQGKNLHPTTYIWARTVPSPSPAFSGKMVPLASTFVLSSKAGKEAAIVPVISGDSYSFTVKCRDQSALKNASDGTKAGKRAGFKCILSGDPISFDYIRKIASENGFGIELMAIVADGNRERIYLPASRDQSSISDDVPSTWSPRLKLQGKCRVNVANYGFDVFGDLFTKRQLLALNTFAECIKEIRSEIKSDAINAGFDPVDTSLDDGGTGAGAYADAVCTYLAIATSRWSDNCNSIASWNNTNQNLRVCFTKQAIPMSWDFAEISPFAPSGGWMSIISSCQDILSTLQPSARGLSMQADARCQRISAGKIIQTDPPYYDNVQYADLSDFFYTWLKHMLGDTYKSLCSTISTPKSDELVATPHRHESMRASEEFFLNGMKEAMKVIADNAHPGYPILIYYAFKQSEKVEGGSFLSTGWSTFLEAVISSGLAINGTWPIKTEKTTGTKTGMNALASSIILTCSKRESDNATMSKKDFRRALKTAVSKSLKSLEKANIAPVDVAQAVIGPGMAVFSSAKAVLNPDDSSISVKEALIQINAALDEYLSQDEGELDADSRFALTFFESFGYAERDFGDAEGLAKARNVSVEGVVKAGILRSVAGKAWLLRREQLIDDWDPTRDDRLCVWEATQHLIKRLESGGEGAAAELLSQIKKVAGHGDLAANCRALAYRLYNQCEKTKQAEEARAYNGLVIAWPELERLAASQGTKTAVQASLI
jgi:putative DNA methylase